MRVECLVREARPAMVITWFLDDKPISPSAIHTNSSTKRSNGNYDSVSSLRLIPSSKVGIISCVCKGLPIGQLTTNITFHSVGEPTIFSNIFRIFILLIVVWFCFITFNFFLVYLSLLKHRTRWNHAASLYWKIVDTGCFSFGRTAWVLFHMHIYLR